MRKEEKTREIKETVYISCDGREFSSEQECKDYEHSLEEKIKNHPCPRCRGSKWIKTNKLVFVEPEFRALETEPRYEEIRCPVCQGRGYIE